MKTNTTTIPQITFYVACDDNLKSTVRKACAIWSDVLSGYVTLQPWEMGRVVPDPCCSLTCVCLSAFGATESLGLPRW